MGRRLRLPGWLGFTLLALLAIAAGTAASWRATFAAVRDDGRLAAWANARPERLRISWRAIHSPLPGRLEITGLRVAGRTARLRWEVTAETASGWLAPTPLLRRELAFTAIRARGVRVVVESNAKVEAATVAGEPPPRRIPDFPAGALLQIATSARPWSYAFRDIEVEDLDEVQLDDRRFTGSAQGRGGFTIRRRRTAEILPSRLRLSGVAVETPGGRLAESVDGTLRFRIEPYAYRGVRPADLLPRFTGEVDLTGDLDPEAVLAFLSRGWPSLELESGVSRVATRLRLVRGRLAPDSRLELSAARQRVRFLGFEARGTAELTARVEGGLGAPHLLSELQLAKWELGRPGVPGVLFGDLLRLNARAEVSGLLHAPSGGRLEVDLGRARVPDLRFLNDFLPAAAGIQVERGEAGLTGALSLSSPDGGAGGHLELRGEQVRLAARGQRLTANLEADVRLSEPDLAARAFSLAGTRVAIRRMSAETSGGDRVADWWGDATLTSGRIDLRPPLSFAGDFTAKLADTRPLVAFYEIRRDLSEWTERLLTLEGPSATGSFRWSPGRFELERGFLPLRNGELRARFLLEGGESRGKLLARWRRLVLGVELAGGERRIKLRDVEGWFADETRPDAAP